MSEDRVQTVTRQAVEDLREQLAPERQNGHAEPLARGPQGLLPLPEAVERFAFPEDSRYAGHWARLVCNPPEAVMRALPADNMVEALLLAVVREWSFLDPASPPAAPRALPLTADGLGQVPGEAQLWLFAEYLERRADPLLRKTPKPSPPPPPASPS